jgi:NAD(P)-dependent dehydrogenase (short-subunit alcohol dehydrogenase family)
MSEFQGKIALVTGGGSGIGQAVASLFAASGATVVIADMTESRARESVEMIKTAGGQSVVIPCDVTQSDQVAALMNQIIMRFGRLDYAHNNAGGTTEFARLADTSEEYWHRCIAVHLTGVWLCMKEQIKQMQRQGGGAIVNTASIAGASGMRGVSAYVAAKHGVVGLTKTAALEYATAGIRVNAVCPGGVLTPIVKQFEHDNPDASHVFKTMHALKRYGQPAEVAEAVVWLCSESASFITGAALPVDGGYLAGQF